MDGPKEAFQFTNGRNQYVATITANVIFFAHGIVLGWISPALAILSSKETPLSDGILTNEQISWLGSINCIGGLTGSLLFGYFVSLLQPKRTMFLLTIPTIVHWLLIYFGNTFYHVLIARFVCGLTGGGMQCVTILYVSEIANDNIRGRLGSMPLFMRNVGTFVAFTLGAYVDYHTIPGICISMPILYAICLIFLPNTPQFHLLKGNIEKAETALKFYKGCDGKSVMEDMAITKELEKLKVLSSQRKMVEEKSHISDIFNRNALKGIGIGLALSIFSTLTANYTIMSYAVVMFEKAGTAIDPYIASIILSVTLIFGSFATTFLCEKFGRKTLNAITLLGSGLGLFTAALYFYLNQHKFDLSAFAFVPVLSLAFVIFISAAGQQLVLICSVEYLPARDRTFGTSIIVFGLSIIGFVSVKIFPMLTEIFELYGCLSIYAVGCILGSMFVLLVMKETAGKALDDIETRRHTSRLNSIC